MARDEVRAHARSVLGEEAFDQAEAEWLRRAREEKTWAVDIAPAPGGVREDPDAALSLAMVMAGEWVAHAEVLSHRPAGAGERARDMVAAVAAAGRALGVLPERLAVPDPELVEPVTRELAGRGITVICDTWEEMCRTMTAALANLDPSAAEGLMTVALTWRETEATPEELRDFHEAAAAFFTAMPWALDETAGPFLLELPLDPEDKPVPELGIHSTRVWAASVMGAMGETFGLVLHSQPVDLVNIYASDDPTAAFADGIGFALTVEFEPRRELTRTMQREVAAAGWPVATPRAYPRLYGLSLPDRRVLARDVRTATKALWAIAVLARGGDPLAETGVRVTPWDPEEEEDWESRVDWLNTPDQAAPIRAEAEGTEPYFPLWDSPEVISARMVAERERIHRFGEWLREQGVPDGELELELRNADAWGWALASAGTAEAVTEYDLRLFLYDVYVRKTDPGSEAVEALPRSMRRIVRWLEECEGIRYPFAAAVLDELEQIAERARQMDEPLKETLRILSYEIYDDLDSRAMLPSSDGWPDAANLELAQLRDELQRRWLMWYDELVRGGVTDFDALEDALLARQRAWEGTPHPRVGGRTPIEVIEDQVRSN